MSEQPPNPFRLSPGMAKMNQTASGCGYWLALASLLLLVGGVVVALAVLVL